MTRSPVEEPVPKEPDPQVLQDINDHLKTGEKFMDQGEYPDALQEFGAVLKLDPANAKALAWLDRAKEAQATEEKLVRGR